MVQQNAKALILFIFAIFFISFTSSLEPYTLNEEADIRHPVRVGGGIAPVQTNCNITISYPNKTSFINSQPMSRQTDYYNFTLNNTQTTLSGVYDYNVNCVYGGLNETLSSSFIINPGGIEPSQQRTDALSRTIWFFFGLGVLCFLSLFFIKRMPIKITMFLFMVWFILMGINTSMIAMQDEVINPEIQSFFDFFLVLSFLANQFIIYGVAIFWIVIFFANFKERLKWKKNERYNYG